VLSFMRWAIERGVLDLSSPDSRGSPWWRAISDELFRHQVGADLLADGTAFLDLHNQCPDPYPPRGWSMEDLLVEHGRLAQVIDLGLIPSDLTGLYGFAAAALGEPRIETLVSDGTPCYAWPAEDRAPWLVGATRPLARAIARATGHPYR
jgi:hypothetical protein